jgi:hypothetical protein
MTINIDFDGTVVSHEYPLIGKDIGSIPVLKKMLESGCKLILFTMRSGEGLAAAVKWFEDNDIPLFGINKNPTQGVWTNSPKSYAELMIDDSALGIPLIFDQNISRRPFVDWKIVEEMLLARDIIKKATV